jgi:epoxyqueuosine reductase QueG
MICHAKCPWYKVWAYHQRLMNQQIKAEAEKDKPEKERRAAMKDYRLKKKMGK